MIKIDGEEYYGWCCQEKIDFMKQWATNNDVHLFVEIGVYGGASFVPVARILDAKGDSSSHAIDPWDKVFTLIDSDGADKVWWDKNPDLLLAKESFLAKVKGLASVCVAEDTSDNCKDDFSHNTIGMLHIDGSHGFQALFDAHNYYPLVKKGGLIIMDDINWHFRGRDTVKMAIEYLEDKGCKRLADISNCAFLVKQ
jgi:predicted O-methyltransferase YrrM